MEDDLLDAITVATTGNVCFIIAVIFDVGTIPALLCGVAASVAQAVLIRAVYLR
ncbi:hypothetical protein [Mesorhizobium sp.]|uniref:hypothetical protein n=1 Tax=Mesorhizobium sp. TaxID=1871066 RepID=UPI0025CD75F6|nr:hypothetical protein [Mesorhizobium sp.]